MEQRYSQPKLEAWHDCGELLAWPGIAVDHPCSNGTKALKARHVAVTGDCVRWFGQTSDLVRLAAAAAVLLSAVVFTLLLLSSFAALTDQLLCDVC